MSSEGVYWWKVCVCVFERGCNTALPVYQDREIVPQTWKSAGICSEERARTLVIREAIKRKWYFLRICFISF